MIYDTQICALGEGPLWHPTRETLFWFDILEKSLFWQEGGQTHKFTHSGHISAAGWVDRDRLIVASDTALNLWVVGADTLEPICDLEAGNRLTRSNDGRADPWGGFWIGTMGLNAEPRAGAIYRFYKGELRQLFPDITISNAICFDPDQSCAYFTDTPTRQIKRVDLDLDGWPASPARTLIDTGDHAPDGAVVDADGNIWNAQWGSFRVACYGPDGSFLRAVDVPAKQPSCPAFGGRDLSTLFVTTAACDLPQTQAQAQLDAYPGNGQVHAFPETAKGRPECQVIL